MPYSPLINPGTPPLSGVPVRSPFSLYSDKKIVSSSQGIRNMALETKVKAEELEQQLNDFELRSKQSPFNKIMTK